MARVYMGTQGWGVLLDTAGNVAPNQSVTVKNRDGSNATHYSARTGGSSSTSSITSSSTGTLDRWINPGSYTLTVGASTYDVEATEGSKPAYPQPTADDTTNLTSYIAANDEINLRSGAHTISAISLAGLSNKRIRGAGTQATSITVTNATGNIFDFTNASFCTVEDLSIVCSTQRTAGALFYLDHGAGTCQRNEFRRLRIHGGWRAFFLDDCTTVTIDEIQVTDYNAAHGWHSVIHLGGAAVSVILSNIRGGSAATVTNGFLYIDGSAVDTVQCRNFDVLNLSPSTGMYGANVVAGEWIKFSDCSFEAGTTADGMVINGTAKGIDIIGGHLLGLRGLNIVAGTSVRMIGGEVVGCYNHGILVSGGTHHEIIGVTISDCSQQTTGVSNGILVAAGVTDFTITDNHFGKMLLAGANSMATAITINSGASDRYVIARNRVATTGVVTPLSENGTGTDKVVRNNVWAGSGYPSVASAATLNVDGTAANAELIQVTGTTGITSITASGKGRRITLVFTNATPGTVTDGSNLKLAGNFTPTTDDTLTLQCDGTNWIEVARSAN